MGLAFEHCGALQSAFTSPNGLFIKRTESEHTEQIIVRLVCVHFTTSQFYKHFNWLFYVWQFVARVSSAVASNRRFSLG